MLRVDFDGGHDTNDLSNARSDVEYANDYAPEMLVGRQVAAVVNFAPRQIGTFMSEVLTLGFPDADGSVVLVAPDHRVPDGGRLF